MLNTAAKWLLAVATVAALLGLGVAFFVADPGAMVLVLSVAGALYVSAVAVAASGFVDRAPTYITHHDAPPIQMVSGGPSLAPKPSGWPPVAAAALGLVVLGLAVTNALVIVGIVLALLAAAGWLSQAWREDPSFTPRDGAHVSSRLLTPAGLPLMALAVIAVVVISVSRILLAVPRAGSIIIAFALALALLVVFFALSARPQLRRNSLVAMAAVTIIGLVAAGSISAGHGYRTFEHKPGPGAIVEVARSTKFQLTTISVTQGQEARIEFENQDRGVYHNIAVYGSDGTTPIWAGQPVDGVHKILYVNTFDLPPGQYTFKCNFHPTSMIGAFEVTAASTTGTGES